MAPHQNSSLAGKYSVIKLAPPGKTIGSLTTGLLDRVHIVLLLLLLLSSHSQASMLPPSARS